MLQTREARGRRLADEDDLRLEDADRQVAGAAAAADQPGRVEGEVEQRLVELAELLVHGDVALVGLRRGFRRVGGRAGGRASGDCGQEA